MDMMCINIWHHGENIEAGMQRQSNLELTKKSGIIKILVLPYTFGQDQCHICYY